VVIELNTLCALCVAIFECSFARDDGFHQRFLFVLENFGFYIIFDCV
jgi:hypothetical protein